ncbi:O-antigen ligase family protein [Bacillus salacetis]|uniref:O-antigen ligase family protein n=1 Tax=Bacillus salacetis TaxID=2315464 RepID=UPI003BA3D3E5
MERKINRLQWIFQVLLVTLPVLFIYFIFKSGYVTSTKTTLFLMIVYMGFIGVLLWKKRAAENLRLETVLLYLLIASAFLQASFFVIELGPFSLFPYRLLFLSVTALLVLTVLFNRGFIYEVDLKVKGYAAFLVFWLIYALLSFTWVKNIVDAIKYFVVIGIGIMVIFLVVLLFRKFSNYIIFYYTWIFMLVIVTAIGVWNHVTEHHLVTSAIINEPPHKQHIPTSVFKNQNDFASYLAISVFFLSASIKYIKNFIYRLACLGLLGVMLYLIYVTESRASILAIVIGAAGMFFLWLSTKNKKRLVIAGAVLAALLFIVKFDTFYNIYNKVTEFNPALQVTDSNDMRRNLLLNSTNFIIDTYGFGVGSGNAEHYMKYYKEYPTGGILNVHNWWVEIFVDFGAVIFIGYVLLFIGLIFHIYRFSKMSVNRFEKMVSHALLGSLITLSFASISPSSMSNLNYYWILLAFALGFVNWSRIKYSNKGVS